MASYVSVSIFTVSPVTSKGVSYSKTQKLKKQFKVKKDHVSYVEDLTLTFAPDDRESKKLSRVYMDSGTVFLTDTSTANSLLE